MPITVTRPSGVNVGVFNPATEVYITGNETTDGGIRFQFTSPDQFAHIELRTNGVWSDTGLRTFPLSVTENLMLDTSLNIMFDLNLDPMYSVQFP